MMKLAGVGSNLLSIVVVVLVVGLILFYVIQSARNDAIEDTEREVIQDIQNQQQKVRTKVQEEVTKGRNSTVDEALDYLERRGQ
jgi:type II secretory pathway pseudopilin PulG